jgi:hypothetical protein
MKAIAKHTFFCLLAVCILANSSASFFFPKKYVSRSTTVLDVHHDNLPAQGKEEKNEILKVARKSLSIPLPKTETFPQRFFEYHSPLETQIFLPVILPPPKAIA